MHEFYHKISEIYHLNSKIPAYNPNVDRKKSFCEVHTMIPFRPFGYPGHQHHNSSSSGLRAFTLIELLVVISIISLLIAILLPALGAARAQSKTLSCLSKMRQIGMAFTMYENDNRQFFPPSGIDAPTTQNPGGKLYYIDLLKPYVGDRTPVPNADNYLWFNNASPNPEVFQCPELLYSQSSRTAFSGMGYNNYALVASSVGGLWSDNWIRQIDIRKPSNIMVVADANELSPYQGASGLNTAEKTDFRHNGSRVNYLYADTHCKTVPEDEVKVGWSNFYRKYPYMENWK